MNAEEINPIQEFYKNEEIFITGGSGLIGKTLIEKLLRSFNGVKKIYVLLRTKKGENSDERLEKLKSSQIFDRIRDSGNGDELNKLHAVSGDIENIRLGLSDEDLERLQNVSIIFHIAATVRFDEPLKKAILQNVRGTREILLIAEKLKNLKMFIHCSTAYSNPHLKYVEEKLYSVYTDWENYIKMAEKYDQLELDIYTSKILDKFPNTYSFSKHVAEHVVNSFRHQVPAAIFRPSIVIPALQEPFQGWFDSFIGAVGVFVGVTAGIIRVFEGDKNLHLDFTPLDCTSACQIIMAWKERHIQPVLKFEDDVRVYHLCCGCVQSFSLNDIFNELLKVNEKKPLEKTLWIPRIAIYNSSFLYNLNVYLFQLIPAFLIDGLIKLTGNEPFLLRLNRRIYFSLKILTFFTKKKFNFESTQLEKMIDDLKYLDCDMPIDRFNYLNEVTLLVHEGARKYVLKNSYLPEAIEKCKSRFQKMKWIDNIIRYMFLYWISGKALTFLFESDVFNIFGN